MRVPAVVFLIPCLNGFCRPAAISWLVQPLTLLAFAAGIVSLRVDAVNGVFGGRCYAYVIEEVPKGFSPAFADVGSKCSVESPVDPIMVITAVEHICPYLVLAGLGEAVSRQTNTATISSRPRREMIGSNNFFLTAVAAAEPDDPAVPPRCLLKYDKFSETLSGEIDRMAVSHDVSFREKDAFWSGPAAACNNRAARFLILC